MCTTEPDDDNEDPRVGCLCNCACVLSDENVDYIMLIMMMSMMMIVMMMMTMEGRVLVSVFCLRSEQPHSPHSAPSFAWSRSSSW